MRKAVLTRYGVFEAHLAEELGGGTAFAAMELLESLANAFAGVGECGDVEEALVFGGILEDDGGPVIDRQGDGAACALECLDGLGGVVAEGGEGLGVGEGFEHALPPLVGFYAKVRRD